MKQRHTELKQGSEDIKNRDVKDKTIATEIKVKLNKCSNTYCFR